MIRGLQRTRPLPFSGNIKFSNEYVYFRNGVASTYVSKSIWNTNPIVDEISAEIYSDNKRYYDKEIASLLDKKHVKEVFFDAPLRTEKRAVLPIWKSDSSSTRRAVCGKTDPDRFRVTKTEEFLDALRHIK